eukprot:672316-Hanusia_phi.AAC.3
MVAVAAHELSPTDSNDPPNVRAVHPPSPEERRQNTSESKGQAALRTSIAFESFLQVEKTVPISLTDLQVIRPPTTELDAT